ncbi:UBX domain-containing protein 1 isoform X1 [Latimeria chalumnae]|uniref:UBX domain-containing protein 1 isoform X1 n=1 Tax=Latimeria chalumnae TaxID=7897 RepID=UPI0006D8F7B2|nr:PREDICTED: UBX domain-containing protein 1 [Latimeria chalumnae]|eukprot:XP_014339427.1 PREDICTED: UBX domain-containing protein 1 [Latimeria chalumnae]
MAECTALESLLEMGFPKNRAEKAIALSGNQGIERAMDWLVEHENDPDIDEPYVPPQGNAVGSGDTPESEETGTSVETADPEAEGSAKSQGKQPLTEEEKREQIKRLEELMVQKQREREEREKQEAIEREKQRRRQGQELSMIRQKHQEEEMKKLAEERRREKIEERLAKQRVREKIERDKAERAKKFGGGGGSSAQSPPSTDAVPETPPSSFQGPPAKREYEECRIQIRLLDGSTLTQTFRAKEQMAAVRLYVELNRTDGQEPFNLITTFPRRVFTEEDMEKPLQELGLVPSAVLTVSKK